MLHLLQRRHPAAEKSEFLRKLRYGDISMAVGIGLEKDHIIPLTPGPVP